MTTPFGQITRLPAVPQVTENNLTRVAQTVKEIVEVWQGARGDGLDRVITVRDLLNSGVMDPKAAAQLYVGAGSPVPPPISGKPLDSAIPPTPTNLTADGAIGTIILSWDFPISYTRLAYFEVWRSATNALGDAVLLAQPFGSMYADSVGLDATFYYWVRAVSDGGVSPFNAVAGVLGTTPPAFEDLTDGTNNGVPFTGGTYIKDAYIKNGAITNARIGNLAVDTAKIADAAIVTAKIADAQISTAKIINLAVTTAKIDNLAVTTAKIQDLAVDTAKIADLAVTDAKIATLDAGKINTGFLHADRIEAGTITADKLTVTQLSAITADLGTITAGVIQNSTDSVNIDMNATGGALLLRAGAFSSYGPYAGSHYAVELYADGSAFFARDVMAGGALKASGTYTIPDMDRPAVIFQSAPSSDNGGAAGA